MPTSVMARHLRHQSMDDRRRNATHYVLASEIIGLEGTFHPFGDPVMAPINIHQQDHGKILVSNHNGHITLQNDDSFRIGPDRKLLLITGPLGHKDPYRAAIAGTVLGQSMLTIEETPIPWVVQDSMAAYAYKFEDGVPVENIFLDSDWLNFDNEEVVVDESWDVYIKKYNSRVTQIVKRQHATLDGAEWLARKLEYFKLYRKPSGMFDEAQQERRSQQDIADEQWIERISLEAQAERERIAAEDHRTKTTQAAMLQLALSQAGTQSLKIDNKLYVIRDGKFYRNAVSQKTFVTVEHLVESGMGVKVYEALATK